MNVEQFMPNRARYVERRFARFISGDVKQRSRKEQAASKFTRARPNSDGKKGTMATNYDEIAAEYKRAKQQPWRLQVEHFTLFKLLGDLSGKNVIDLACGEGFFTRSIKRAGAARVLGVDISQGMIDLARREEVNNPLGIEYVVQDVTRLNLGETFDVVVAAYLLNYAQSSAQLLEMCRAIARHLKPGCWFVTVNNNPNHETEDFMSTRKYGFIKQAHGPLVDGAPVDYIIFLDDGSFTITNYHLSVKTHEAAFMDAGFRQVRWHAPELSTQIAQTAERDEWSEFLDRPPVIFIECMK